MNLQAWGMIGLIVGVISTAWQPKLTGRMLLLEMSIGAIGAISGGVLGYILYNSTFDEFNISVFAISLMITVLTVILKRKIRSVTLQSPLPEVQVSNSLTSLSINS